MHGSFSYQRKLNTKSTFNTANTNLNQTYNFQIYKGFLTGNFKFEYNDITYTSSKTVSVAEINNGNRTFVFDGSIELQTVIVTMPLFRFPLIGK